MIQVFVDLDGVLSDFDGHYKSCFGIKPDKSKADPPDFWDKIRDHGSFFRTASPMFDALYLWEGVKLLHSNPIILTGMPSSIKDVEKQKREWVKEYIDPNAQVICCFSKNKRNYAKIGDILIDDWDKYKHLWEEIGGIFILHKSAKQSLKELRYHLDPLQPE